MDKRLYAAAIGADRTVGTMNQWRAHAYAIMAHNEAEAMGLAIQIAQEEYPSADGWRHQASITEVPVEMVQQCAQAKEEHNG